jgi:hypothetical protein
MSINLFIFIIFYTETSLVVLHHKDHVLGQQHLDHETSHNENRHQEDMKKIKKINYITLFLYALAI